MLLGIIFVEQPNSKIQAALHKHSQFIIAAKL